MVSDMGLMVCFDHGKQKHQAAEVEENMGTGYHDFGTGKSRDPGIERMVNMKVAANLLKAPFSSDTTLFSSHQLICQPAQLPWNDCLIFCIAEFPKRNVARWAFDIL